MDGLNEIFDSTQESVFACHFQKTYFNRSLFLIVSGTNFWIKFFNKLIPKDSNLREFYSKSVDAVNWSSFAKYLIFKMWKLNI